MERELRSREGKSSSSGTISESERDLAGGMGGSDDDEKGKAHGKAGGGGGVIPNFFKAKMHESDVEMGDIGTTWTSPKGAGGGGSEWEVPLDPEDEEQALLPGNDGGSGEEGGLEKLAIPRYYQASWPSLVPRVMHYARPAIDIWVWLFLIMACILTGEPGATDSLLWRTVRGNTWFFLWLPFWYRFCTGFVHFLMSLPILPGPVLYHEGPLLKHFPASVMEMVSESYMMRQMNRPRLQAAGGITIQLVAPDGCAFEAMYFRGEGASQHGPTVIRFNGNAEAIELQDEVMPRMYTTAGINFLMFNYRGVGRSRYTKAYFNNDVVSHLIGLARTPTREGVTLDAWTVVEFVTKELGVPCNKLVLVGHSIGGAVSTQLAASHSSLRFSLCNSRSMASLTKVVVAIAPSFLGIPPASKKGRALRVLAQVAMLTSGWEFDSFGNWGKVQGFKWVEFSGADHIIPHELSLHAAIAAQEEKQPPEGDAKARIIALINLVGMDNHNRMWLDTEMVQHLDMVAQAVALDGEGLSPVERDIAKKKREGVLYKLLESSYRQRQ